jgi:hypothetical protein
MRFLEEDKSALLREIEAIELWGECKAPGGLVSAGVMLPRHQPNHSHQL